MSDENLARLLREKSALIQAARPYMRALSRAAGEHRHAAMLGDERALVLDVVGDDASIRGPESVPGPGALLSEAVSGANGIGTPLAEGTYSELIGPEHFISGFHPFTCQGVPLIGPESQVVGVLSISMRSPTAATRLRDILVCAGHGIEAELLRVQLEEDIRQVLEATPGDDTALENLRQDLMQLHATARLRLQGAAALLGHYRDENALRLLQVAQSTAREFQLRARMFQELAGSELGAARAVELHEQVRQLLALLSTESRIRAVDVFSEHLTPCTVEADPRRLARQLLSRLLHAFELAEGGGSVRVRLLPVGGAGRVTISAQPAPGRPREPVSFTLELPLRGALT
ncbi:sigma-54-dependent transcriptional regulator family protein [Hyalangium gracile]|uniref:hypothetical protein n=1 Tax=Hyalangium gracile TaxID=394092 RepID=UPI001CC9A30F|nr:hypothetical protein [Hyalangium gracile]